MHENITLKGESDYEFITRRISGSRSLEARRRNYQHNSYLFVVVLVTRILYELNAL